MATNAPTPAPLRGADAVNDEFEVGYDAGFERRWRRAELAGRVVMALFVAAALFGLLGRGPFSHHTARSADGQLGVDYEPVARYGTTTQATLHLSSPSATGADGMRRVWVYVSSAVIEPMGLQAIVPRPAATEAVGGGVRYAFDVPPGENSALVRFVLKPAVVGPVSMQAREGEETVAWTQVVLP